MRVALLAVVALPSAAQRLVDPSTLRDGSFHVAAKAEREFSTRLTETWCFPNAGDTDVIVYAPVAPSLPGQTKVKTILRLQGEKSRECAVVEEPSGAKRSFLTLTIPGAKLARAPGLSIELVYEGRLMSRSIRLGRPPVPVPVLTDAERERFTAKSETMDWDDVEVQRWIADNELVRAPDEQVIQFAARAFRFIVQTCKYGGDNRDYAARKPSRVVRTLTSDCGGLSLLFCAVMRNSSVPARTLFGRWALPQTDAYGQYHVVAEFFVPGSGWVPVDTSGTIAHKPANVFAFFGTSGGDHLAFHLDTDLRLDDSFVHGWAQYLLLRPATDQGAWERSTSRSKWDVWRKELSTSRRR